MADAEIEEMRKRMTEAAQADAEAVKNGQPASQKLKLLPEVLALLNRNTYQSALMDPETNLLEAVRFFLEPLADGSLPAYNIQRELFAVLAKLPMTKETLISSGIGKVIFFYRRSKRPEPSIKRQATKLMEDWSRPILQRSDDYSKKQFQTASYDPTQSIAIDRPLLATRAKGNRAPGEKTSNRARYIPGVTSYTIAPVSNVVAMPRR